MTDRLSVGTSSPTTTVTLSADEIQLDAANNRSLVRCYLRQSTSATANYAWHDASVSASAAGVGFGFSGTDADFGSGGGGWGTRGPYDVWVQHNADGSGYCSLGLSVNYPHASGKGGSTSGGFYLTTLTQPPGVPSGLSLVRNSDSQATASWTNNAPSNGQPTSVLVQKSVNGGSFADVASIAPSGSMAFAIDVNQKVVFRARESNAAGSGAFSASSSPIFTTPAAPSAVAAAKDASSNILVSWTDNVAFAEHQHLVLHGTVGAGSAITWDASPLATVTAGTTSFTHVAPASSAVHVYALAAKNTDTGALQSTQVQSNSVVLLTAPNKPTLPTLGPCVDRAKAFVVTWTHNAVDTTAQTAYEFGVSTNGGSTWTSSGKVASAVSSRSIAANTYSANQQLAVRVRTWGQATTGGSDGTGASPWSDPQTVTFKTRPTATILAPTSTPGYGKSALTVGLGFAQAESATFVSATIQLFQGSTLLEQKVSTTLSSTAMDTRVANGAAYTVKVTALDSNGLVSDIATVMFNVTYTSPVPAGVVVTYLPDSGIGQLDITIPAPGSGQVAAVTVSVTRTIDGVQETVVSSYPVAASLTILDTTPTIRGDNVYAVTTVSADGATAETDATMTTDEGEWAFMSKGAAFDQIVRFGGDLKPQATPTIASALVQTAGRSRPIGLYGKTGGLVVSGTGDVVEGIGSTAEELEAFLLIPGKACYRDPTGRRMFGQVSGQVSRDTWNLGTFPYTVTETS